MINTALQSISLNFVVQRILQSAPTWLNVIIVLILGYWLADLVWMLARITDSSQTPTVQMTSSRSDAASEFMFYGAKIADKHLFGKVNLAFEVKSIKDAPKTKLDLVLRGVLAYKPMKEALALISHGNGRQEVYMVGDSLPKNADLVEIYSDRVIIEYQGRYETLLLEKIEGILLQTNVMPQEILRKTIKPFIAPQRVIAPQRAIALRKAFLADPSKLMSMIHIKQQLSGGKLLGYQINPKGDSSLLYELGLQEGDLLISVNGFPVSNRQALNGLRGAERYDVVVMRDGVKIPLSISFLNK